MEKYFFTSYKSVEVVLNDTYNRIPNLINNGINTYQLTLWDKEWENLADFFINSVDELNDLYTKIKIDIQNSNLKITRECNDDLNTIILLDDINNLLGYLGIVSKITINFYKIIVILDKAPPSNIELNQYYWDPYVNAYYYFLELGYKYELKYTKYNELCKELYILLKKFSATLFHRIIKHSLISSRQNIFEIVYPDIFDEISIFMIE